MTPAMILFSLFGLWLILMLAILLWPIPDPGRADPCALAAYRRAGDRFYRVMLSLLIASVLVAVVANAYLEVLQAQRVGTTPAGVERQATP